MAEYTRARNNVLGYPVYGLPWVVCFPLMGASLDSDDNPITGATCDSEISKNGNTAVDCHNEGVEIAFDTTANKGMYYLDLTGAHTGTETAADVVAITIASATTKTRTIVLYPKKLPKLLVNQTVGATGNDTTHIHLATGLAIDDFYNGCIVHLNESANDEVRMITDYVASTRLATLNSALDAAPTASTSTYDVYLTETAQANMLALSVGMIPNVVAGNIGGLLTAPTTANVGLSDLVRVNGATQTATLDTIKAETVLIVADTGELQTNQGNWLTATGFATPTNITAASGVALSATGLDLVAKTATGALALADAVWDEEMAGHTTADTSGLVMNEWQDAGRLDAILDTIATDVAGLDGAAMVGAAPTAAAVASAVWKDTTAADFTEASSVGKSLMNGVALGTGLTVAAVTGGALEATLTAIKGATWSASTDTLEALRDRGDTAWITATGFATPTNITAASGITVATNNDKTGYSLSQTFPTNFSALSISATTGLVDITQTAADKVWGTTARVLTAGTNIALAKGTGLTGLNDIAATAIVSGGAITTSGGVASADVKKVNNVTVTGTGTATDPWGP